MTSFQFTPMPGAAPAVLTLPQPLTRQALLELEQALTSTLGMLRRDLRDGSDAEAAEHLSRRQTAGEIEYLSWMLDSGTIEYASWMAQLHASRQ